MKKHAIIALGALIGPTLAHADADGAVSFLWGYYKPHQLTMTTPKWKWNYMGQNDGTVTLSTPWTTVPAASPASLYMYSRPGWSQGPGWMYYYKQHEIVNGQTGPLIGEFVIHSVTGGCNLTLDIEDPQSLNAQGPYSGDFDLTHKPGFSVGVTDKLGHFFALCIAGGGNYPTYVRVVTDGTNWQDDSGLPQNGVLPGTPWVEVPHGNNTYRIEMLLLNSNFRVSVHGNVINWGTALSPIWEYPYSATPSVTNTNQRSSIWFGRRSQTEGASFSLRGLSFHAAQ